MAPTRRTVLTYGLVGTAVLVCGGVGLGLRQGVMHRPHAPLRALEPRAFSVLVAVAARVAPGGPSFPTAGDVDVVGKVDALLARMHPGITWEINQLLKAFDNALSSAMFGHGITPFTALEPEQQDEVLEAWRTSSLWVRRLGYKVVRDLVVNAYYGSPEVYEACGYPGPPDFSAMMEQRAAEAARKAELQARVDEVLPGEHPVEVEEAP